MNLLTRLNSLGRPLIVAIQGLSSNDANKTAEYIGENLKVRGIETLNIKIESYYKTVNWNASGIQVYDFDNPAAIDWDFLRKTLRDIKAIKYNISMCKFDPCNLNNVKFSQKNNFPDVIILAGKYALNLFNDRIFNVSKFDCMKPQSQKIDVEYIDNPDNFYNDFRIIKISYLTKIANVSKTMSDVNFEIGHEFKKYCIGDLSSELKIQCFLKTSRWINYAKQADFVIDEGKLCFDARQEILEKVFESLNTGLEFYC